MDKWQELTVTVNREAQEAVANILVESGSQGVAITDSADYLGPVGKYGELFPEVEQSDQVKITAYYPESMGIEAIKAQVNQAIQELPEFGLKTGQAELSSHELAEEDWAENWKKYYQPTRIHQILR